MENTLENKAKVFALYWGQEVIKVDMPEWIGKPNREVYALTMDSDSFKHFQLQLKPISSISDEDAEYCIGKRECQLRINDPNHPDYGTSPSFIFVDSMIGDDSFYITKHNIDYLRSKGYALPGFGLSIEQLVNRGWFKLV